MILDAAGGVLPEGLSFLHLGWWVLHGAAILFTFLYGYRKGRGDERRRQQAKAMEGERKH
jgi:hypothetical protein